MEIYLAILGIFLGVSLAGPPGPVTAILVKKASVSVPAGVSVGLGAMSADFILMMITFFIGTTLITTTLEAYVFIVGSAFFLILAVLSLKSQESNGSATGNGYFSGLLIGIVNPFQIGWWVTAGLSVFKEFGFFPFYFMFVGIIGWVLFLSLAVRRSTLRFGEKATDVVRIFSFAILVLFAVYFAYIGFVDLI
ncbi:MAG: LysE family translocator [Thermoplasmata archaeon]